MTVNMQYKKYTYKTALLGFIACLLLLPSALRAQDALTLRWGDNSGFTDVTLLPVPHQAAMDYNTGNVQLQIEASFAAPGTAKTREITVHAPRGYRILAYSAKSGTPAINGVTQLGLSPGEDGKLTGSLLTAEDDTPFANQLITDYTGWNIAEGANVNYRTYDGKLIYSFNSTCDYIVLTLTLSVDTRLVPTTDPLKASGGFNQFTLPDITVEMTSGAATLSNYVGVLFSGLVLPSISEPTTTSPDNGHSGIAEGVVDPGDLTGNTGTCDFNTGWDFSNYYISIRTNYLDSIIISIPYPVGVTYKGFLVERSWNTDQRNNPANGSYLNGHLTVNNDVVGRILTFTFSKALWSHTSNTTGLQAFWTAVVDNVNIKWNQQLNFNAQATFTSGALITGGIFYTYKQPAASTIWRTPTPPSVNLTLAAMNRVRHDLNADGDFPYDWAIGQFQIKNAGPSLAQNVKYEFTFPSSPQVREVRIPCVAGSTDENVMVTGLTNTGRALNYAFNLGSVNYKGQNLLAYSSAGITSEMLELAAGEYLQNLTIVQQTLQVNDYLTYINAQTSYYGKFTGGQTGNVTLTLSADGFAPITATDHTTINWQQSGAGTMSLDATHTGYRSISSGAIPSGDSNGGSFYPGDSIYFESRYVTGTVVRELNEAVDPVIYINLPAGLDLDPTTVQLLSVAGNNGAVFIPASATVSKTQTIGGTVWTSYKVTVNNKYDIIARARNNMNVNISAIPGVASRYADERNFFLRFKASVAVDADNYPVISTQDIVNIDLLKTAINASSGSVHVTADINNWTGKGTAYNIVAPLAGDNNISVVQKPGLNVYLGIRNYGSVKDFFTYNGSQASVAKLGTDNLAEVRIRYQNTSADVFYAGSEIYLPIPVKGQMYDHYFNNAERQNPADVEDAQTSNESPLWTAELTGQVTLPGFTTYYAIDAATTTNHALPVTETWTPVTMTWYTYSQLTAAGHALANVTMLKFVAAQNIPAAGASGSAGETTLLVNVADNSQIGVLDYWRSYQKGMRNTDGSGTWVYGSVLAAMPAVTGVWGKFFYDINRNGILDTGESYTASSPVPPGYSVTFTGPGIPGSIPMTIDADGNFRSLDGDGEIYYLTGGAYMVTITNSAPELYHITNTTPATRSYYDISMQPIWFNDIQQGSVPPDNISTSFTFMVGVNSAPNAQLVGIGIKDAPRYIPVNPHIRSLITH